LKHTLKKNEKSSLFLTEHRARKLLKIARGISKNAYAPYSHFKVGAALLTESGNIWTGCNVENASYGLTICAERSAVSKAISEGDKQFIAIAVVTSGQKPISPCGSCRQVLLEFNKNLIVITPSSKDKVLQRKISDLLPHAFA